MLEEDGAVLVVVTGTVCTIGGTVTGAVCTIEGTKPGSGFLVESIIR